MAINPETNKIELLKLNPDDLKEIAQPVQFIRENGSVVPKHWVVFKQGELVDIKNYTFRIAYIGETAILFEPVSPTDNLKSLIKEE